MDQRAKFSHPEFTADGTQRAWVDPVGLDTLWFNTGTLCNLTCANCYIESSPSNDRLVYLTLAEVEGYLDELSASEPRCRLIGFTGGEPFMNPDLPAMLAESLSRGWEAIVLTNAMRPMMKRQRELLALHHQHGSRLEVRVSLDHFSAAGHEFERGAKSWDPTITGLKWLAGHGFNLTVAGRTYWEGEDESSLRAGYAELFRSLNIRLDTDDPARLVLFPEMDPHAEVPEITTDCWQILGKSPDQVMCASSRMVVKRKGARKPAVVACTLLPYENEFELGETLAEARVSVSLNHPHCARFCVLGGGSCSIG
ncbi:MAG: radical SAM protein [Xanthomonadales bacterium]|nr:radical SAM protein [Xanthomonadales bacterium]